jgi:glycosyltransferase involved in cell wall biosynthesis
VKNTKVSVIIASYNKEKYISDTISSVVNQSFKNWELIIVDDFSSDSTIDVISSFTKYDQRIALHVNSKNEGANFCRNYAIKIAKGDYVIFLDADDLLTSTCIENRLTVIENSNDDFCVFTMGVFTNQIGDSNYLWQPNSVRPLQDFLQHKLPWSILQPIWRRNFLENLNGFDEEFTRLQDVELHTRALFIPHVKFSQIVENPDCFYRIDEGRKNFSQFVFLQKWILSALTYYSKFYNLARQVSLERKLLGTIYGTYLQILFSFKTNKISRSEYLELKYKLINTEILSGFNFKTRCCFKMATFFNLLPFRIPGANYIISRLVVL